MLRSKPSGAAKRLAAAQAIILLLTSAANASGPAFTKAGLLKLCQTTAFLQKIPGDALKRLSDNKKASAAALVAAHKAAALATNANNVTGAVVYSSLAAATTACATSAEQMASGLATVTIKASSLAQQLAGQVQEMISLLIKKGQTSTPANGYCIVGSGKNAALSEVDADIKCDSSEPTFTANLLSYDGEDMGPEGYKKLTAGTILDTCEHNSKCSFFKFTNGDTATDSFHSNSAKAIFGGLATIMPHANTAATAVPQLPAGPIQPAL
uniref:Variant surface glycoprotein 1125.1589 n=1 Tax=Trypanosoma brucei TaxID=5691 RepID=A0A1J0R7M7_9TRYP|nr:variant surface glycoprotein 1125.1589 [Trypanosoma brucei]